MQNWECLETMDGFLFGSLYRYKNTKQEYLLKAKLTNTQFEGTPLKQADPFPPIILRKVGVIRSICSGLEGTQKKVLTTSEIPNTMLINTKILQ